MYIRRNFVDFCIIYVFYFGKVLKLFYEQTIINIIGDNIIFFWS